MIATTITNPRFRVGNTATQPSPSHSTAVAAAPALTLAQNLICGASARAAQIITGYPIDTVKVRIQVSRSTASSPIAAISSAIRQGTLYRGVIVSLMGQVPYGMLTFGAYESLRAKFKTTFKNYPEWLQIILAASIGDAIGSLWLTPSEVIKSKTQTGLFSSPLAATRATAAQGLTFFYQGYPAALARDIPFRAIQLSLYERIRSWYAGCSLRKQIGAPLSPVENLFLGAVTGTLTAAATNPLDVIRTRMMSQGVGSSALYNNALDCVIKTVSKEGPVALLKGVLPRCVVIGPSTAVFFVVYEMSKSFFRHQQPKRGIQHASRTMLSSRRHRLFA